MRFAADHGQVQHSFVKELDIPYGIIDIDGRLVWANNELKDIVKFEKTEDTMLVYMVASDEKTSQLLNQELDVLRSMLRPYNAQISEVEFKQENVQREMFLSGDDSGYRAGSQSQENDGHHKRPVFHSGRFVDVLPEESDIQAETIALISGNVILNRYI